MEKVINENLKMTKADIEKYLEDHFAGKEFSQWNFAYDTYQVIKALLPKDFADQLAMQTDSRSYGKQSFGIKYGKGSACFLMIEVHKKMTKRGNGYKPSSWYHKAAEYVYGKFEIYWMEDNETLIKRMEDTVAQNNKLIGYANDQEQRAINTVKLLMETYGIKDYEARNLCEYVDKKWYYFVDKLRKELNNN